MPATTERDRRRGRRPGSLRLLVGQLVYQARLLVRTPMTLFATLVVPLMVLLAVDLLFRGKRVIDHGEVPWAQFFTPAMLAFAIVTCCYAGIVASITIAREEGILKRLRSTPLPAWVYMAGRVITAGAVALLAAVVLVVVSAELYGFRVVWSAVPAAAVTLAVAIICFCALGLAVTALVPSVDSALPVAWGSLLPVCFISDVFQPLGAAPGWLLRVSSLLPIRPLADQLEDLFNPLAGERSIDWTQLRVVLAWGLGATIFALLRFRWAPRPPTGRGGGDRRTPFAGHRLSELVQVRREPDRSAARPPADSRRDGNVRVYRGRQ